MIFRHYCSGFKTIKKVLIAVFLLFIDIYSPILGQSAKVDRLFLQIKEKIHEETRLYGSFGKLLGVIDMVLSTNDTSISSNSVSASQ